MVTRSYTTALALVFALAVSVQTQEKPATAADKAAAEKAAAEKAAMAEIANRSAAMAAQQAEAIARAQQKVAEEAALAKRAEIQEAERRAAAIIPVDIEVVVSRYQGDKKTSSLPYFLAVNASERQEKTSLRMGANVPVPSTTFSPLPTDGKPAVNPLVSYNYQDIGTNIDCSARPLDAGRFVVNITVGERSVVQGTNGSGGVAGAPVIRTFSASNNVVLRDGQTRQFTAAADRVTGEVVKVDVTLKVAK